MGYQIWIMVEKGYCPPTITIDQSSQIKRNLERIRNDKELTLCYSYQYLSLRLGADKFNRVRNCFMAKEIWDILEVTHKETNQVKESKTNIFNNMSYLDWRVMKHSKNYFPDLLIWWFKIIRKNLS